MVEQSQQTPVIKHGVNGYTRAKCRCAVCRKEYRDADRRWRAGRHQRLLADPTLRRHGDPMTYQNWGCRCTPCSQAYSIWRGHTPQQPKQQPRPLQRRRDVGQDPKRKALFYEPQNTVRYRQVQPFGREWVRDHESIQ